MKIYIIIIALILHVITIGRVDAQCLAQSSNSASNGNLIGHQWNYNKDQLICDSNNKSGGLIFKAEFENKGTGNYEIFSLNFGNTPLLKVAIHNQQLVITKRVMYRQCNTWNSTGCTSFGTYSFGLVDYRSWDDQLVEIDNGWIEFHLADNGMKTRISSNQNGPYKTDLTYEGLNLSGIEQVLNNGNGSTITISVPRASTSGLRLYNVSTKVGQVDLVSVATVIGSGDSPETNFVSTGSRAFSSQAITSDADEEEVFTIENDFIIYPNPALDEVTISLPEREGEASLMIYNSTGVLLEERSIANADTEELKINVSRYSAGLYLVNLQTSTKQYQSQLMVE